MLQTQPEHRIINESDKRRFIKDPLWGNIELFPWEAKLISQFPVNRLHHIVQNSCAYLVYPGLKYSRFLHSLGALHVATQLFLNLIVNTKPEYLDKLLDEARQIELGFPNRQIRDSLSRIITERTNCPQTFALLLGTIRVAALLHDLGHLPYSHVFEFALERFIHNDFTENLQSAEHRSTDKTQNLRRFHSDLKRHFAGDEKVHEAIGKNLLNLLVSSNESQDEFNFSPFVKCALQVWTEETLSISKSILSADIDADRIDFVFRDGTFSGAFKSSIDFDRLFAFYELGLMQDSNGNHHLQARPSLRASAEAEKLLWERFLDYKYIVSHHKVHLFDEILERLLFYCICDGLVNPILETLITLATVPPDPGSIREKQILLNAEKTVLSCFNDSWIDVQLRHAYNEAGRRTNDKRNVDLRKILYEGLSEQRGFFQSVFKRDEEYSDQFGSRPNLKAPISVSLLVRDKKYTWEYTLSKELNTPVIIGDLSKKLKIGITNVHAAEFFGLKSIKEFLESKYVSSQKLNAWYYSPLTETQKDQEFKRQRIIDFLSAELSQS